MLCTKCQFENREGIKFCEECGAKIEVYCPACGAQLPAERKFCGVCGQKLDEYAEIDWKEPVIESERKQITALFSDLSGYTILAEKKDPEELKEIMTRIFGEIA